MSNLKNTLFVVDDEDAMRGMLRDFFSLQGFNVCCFPSVERAMGALDKVDSSRVAAILSDIRMVPLNGKDLLKQVRGKYPSIPVLLFTAAGAPEERKEAMKLGAAIYLAQPFSLTELKEKLALVMAAGGSK